MEVDHFRTVHEAPALKYEWTNLYPISPLANRMRSKKTPIGGYLDPCAPQDDVEQETIYDITAQGHVISFMPKDSSNLKAKNTAELLERIHNGHDEKTHVAVLGLRVAISTRYTFLAEQIIDYQKAAADNDEGEKIRMECRIRKLLSRQSEFTMLLRSSSIVRRHVPHLIPN